MVTTNKIPNVQSIKPLTRWTMFPLWEPGRGIFWVCRGDLQDGTQLDHSSAIRRVTRRRDGILVQTLNSCYLLAGEPMLNVWRIIGEWGGAVRDQLRELGFTMPRPHRWSQPATRGMTADGLVWRVERRSDLWEAHATESRIHGMVMFEKSTHHLLETAAGAAVQRLRDRIEETKKLLS